MNRFIRPKQLEAQFGIDRVTAWRWSKDEKRRFPKPIRLSVTISVYDEAEVTAWFEQRRTAISHQDNSPIIKRLKWGRK